MNVIPITKKEAEMFVITKHYSHRASIFWKGFGLVEDGLLQGVCVFGQPSPPIQKYAFSERDFRLYELSRLVVQTKTKNAASFLISHSLGMLERPSAVISFADSEQSHCGIVYQATNWVYTGATKSHDHLYLVDGKRVHPITLRNRGISNPKEWAKINNIKTIAPQPKHRYFFFNGNRRQRKDMLTKLKYSIVREYPKCDQHRYNDGPVVEIAK